MTSHNNAEGPDLYLPPNSQALLAALASALTTDHPAEIIYLADSVALPDAVGAAIQARFPQIAFSVRSDRDAIAEFATLPKALPAVLRRNIAISGGRIRFPQGRPPSWLGPRYRNAYIYLSGNFVAKTLRRRAKAIVLREEGLTNYHTLHFGRRKAVLRALTGRSPRQQIMGEERWIDAIQMNSPEALPPALQAKATRLTFSELMNRVPPQDMRDLAAIFWLGREPPRLSQNAALMLTQPLETTGFCSPEEKRALYQRMEAHLRNAGFDVLLKRHPREDLDPVEAADLSAMPQFFPIEAWSWLMPQKFELAVSLCSLALDARGGLFSNHQLQLVDPVAFGRKDLTGWEERLKGFLADYHR